MASIKQQRLANQIRMVLTELFLRELRDPRLQVLTITDVTVDKEAQSADVFVNALGQDESVDEIMPALQKASGFLRRELGRSLRTRNTPQLHFHWDSLPAQAEHINQLLATLEIPPEEEE